MRRGYVIALLLELIGAGGALLVALRTWQVVTTRRAAPLPDDVLRVSGRTIDSASTAFALVALAGVVAVLATRGVIRRLVGLLVALAGAGLVWRAIVSWDAVGVDRARSLIADRHRTLTLGDGVVPAVTVHTVWPALSLACGVLVAVAGGLVAWRGQRWQAMSSRYETPASEADPAKAAASMWTAFDRGEDPTSR